MNKKIYKFRAVLIITLTNLLICSSLWAQSPEKISFQAVIRDESNKLVTYQLIGMQISILQDSVSGAAVYIETQNPTTNANGLVSIEICGGTVVSGDFATIDWANGPYFIKTETDPKGGTNYTITGTSQLLSVPYALHAKTAESISGTISESDPVFNSWDKDYTDLINTPVLWDSTYSSIKDTPDLTVYASKDMANGNISNLANPVNAQDAATKSYVDELKAEILKLKNTNIAGGGVTDIDGNYYNTVKIGNQVWMAENLKTTKYGDGTAITLVTDSLEWWNLSTPGYCWYKNDQDAYGETYGALYNWYVVDENNPKNVCPSGWHVPTDVEWTTLENYLIANGYNYDGTTTEDKIAKSLASVTNWISSTNTGVPGNTDYPAYRNKTSFSALPGGIRDEQRRYPPHYAEFRLSGATGSWWSATEESSGYAYRYTIDYRFSYLGRGWPFKVYGLSVRCIKD